LNDSSAFLPEALLLYQLYYPGFQNRVKPSRYTKPCEFPCTYCDDGKHHLSHIEGMPPVMVGHIAVVLLYAKKPPAEYFIVNVEPLYEIKI
jgi:hypothetical protein